MVHSIFHEQSAIKIDQYVIDFSRFFDNYSLDIVFEQEGGEPI